MNTLTQLTAVAWIVLDSIWSGVIGAWHWVTDTGHEQLNVGYALVFTFMVTAAIRQAADRIIAAIRQLEGRLNLLEANRIRGF